jgi:predicted transcriptional regulator
MATKEKTTARNIKLPDAAWKKLQAQATERETSVGSIVRYAIKKYLNGAK